MATIISPAEATTLLRQTTPGARNILATMIALRLAGWDNVLYWPLPVFAPPVPAVARLETLGLCALVMDPGTLRWGRASGVPADWVCLEPTERLYGLVLALVADAPWDGEIIDDTAWVKRVHQAHGV